VRATGGKVRFTLSPTQGGSIRVCGLTLSLQAPQ